MPEGDTVWLTARRLDKALRAQVITVCDLRIPSLATTDLRGMSIREVVARGKHLLMRLDSDLSLHSHLRMDGSWFISPAGERANRHPDHMIRALIGNSSWLATGYRIHDLHLLHSADEGRLVGHLGPDLLGPDWDATEAARRLRREPERAIGEALLDQRNLAGIGNLYRSETLFIERINPWTPTQDVHVEAVIATAHRLLHANRDHPEQSTTGFLRRGEQHWVYLRAGQPCLRCRTPIRRDEQGSRGSERSTYWCPNCQPASSASGSP